MRLPLGLPVGLVCAGFVLRLAGEPPVVRSGIGLVNTNRSTYLHYPIAIVKPQSGLICCMRDFMPGQGTNYVIEQMHSSGGYLSANANSNTQPCEQAYPQSFGFSPKLPFGYPSSYVNPNTIDHGSGWTLGSPLKK
jgi:hypothetical protein